MLFVRNFLPFYGLQRSVSLGVTIPIYKLSAMKRLLCKKKPRHRIWMKNGTIRFTFSKDFFEATPKLHFHILMTRRPVTQHRKFSSNILKQIYTPFFSLRKSEHVFFNKNGIEEEILLPILTVITILLRKNVITAQDTST